MPVASAVVQIKSVPIIRHLLTNLDNLRDARWDRITFQSQFALLLQPFMPNLCTFYSAVIGAPNFWSVGTVGEGGALISLIPPQPPNYQDSRLPTAATTGLACSVPKVVCTTYMAKEYSYFGQIGWTVDIVATMLEHRIEGKDLVMLCFSTTMIVLATVHFLTSSRALMAPGRFFGSLDRWFSILSKSTYIAQQLLGNGVVIYRAWIIWNRRWTILVIPCCFLLCMTGVGCALIPRTDSRVGTKLMLAFSLTVVVLNIICASLIVYPLWCSQRKKRHSSRNTTKRWSTLLTSMIRILIESAMLQLLIEGFFLILNVINHPVQYMFYCLAVPFVVSALLLSFFESPETSDRQGITFTLITLRIKIFSSIVRPDALHGGEALVTSFTTISLGGLTEHMENEMSTIPERMTSRQEVSVAAVPNGTGEPPDLLK
ncbi:hypothetical protein L218DRAFT_1050989 [Marasmius fiardii PR-910]|nr:hypothetical protein L218DRAFT_1050989 [Marasmius fiardii PR-910]